MQQCVANLLGRVAWYVVANFPDLVEAMSTLS
jgi:hypothetical protein